LKIDKILGKNRPLLSFEFFPPKKLESEYILHETVEVLSRFSPDFVSVTYGAGGSTRDNTLRWTLDIKEKYGLDVMMHLTCIASSRSDIQEIAITLKEYGISNILALRGDPPKDLPADMLKDDFHFAFELVEYLRELNGFSVGVAGYPEGHLEAPSLEKDIEYLKKKVDAGASFVITQLFFDNRYFFDFMDRALAAGVTVPIIPGIMPIVNIGQVQKFTQMCGATVPDPIVRDMDGRDSDDMMKIGVDYAILQCQQLLEAGAAGLHFYTLNRNHATEKVLEVVGAPFHDR
jgi:methylenetetrahydrofolate reductase (NADPH)